jgi:hypothetical protein
MAERFGCGDRAQQEPDVSIGPVDSTTAHCESGVYYGGQPTRLEEADFGLTVTSYPFPWLFK